MTTIDIEALHPRADKRTWCLHGCLLASVVFLFVLVVAVAVFFAVVLMDTRKEIERANATKRALEPQPAGQISGKVHKFAQLKLNHSTDRLENITIGWKLLNSEVSAAKYHQTQQTVQVKDSATYLMYLNVAVRCSNKRHCSEGMVSIQVEDDSKRSKLECEVALFSRAVPGHVKSCFTVTTLNHDERLVTKMFVRGGTHWTLDQEQSQLGLILLENL